MKMNRSKTQSRSLKQIIKNKKQHSFTSLLAEKQKQFRNTVMANNTSFEYLQPIFYNKAIDINLPKPKYKISCRNTKKQYMNIKLNVPKNQFKQQLIPQNKCYSLFKKWTEPSTQFATNEYQYLEQDFQKVYQKDSKYELHKMIKYISSCTQIKSYKKKRNLNSISFDMGIQGSKIKQFSFHAERKNFSNKSYKQRRCSMGKDNIKKLFSIKDQQIKLQRSKNIKRKIIQQQPLSGWN